jgi:ABC-2 type transport system ATP-binding protein
MITIQDVTFGYKKQPLLFNDLSLQVETGSITGLLGKNGAGKTTLLKLLTGLAHPQSGHVEVSGWQPRKRDADFLNDVYFVPEELFTPAATIEQFVKANSLFYPNFNHDLLAKVLNEFELPVNQKLTKMSHGQKKKFIISYALSTKCRFLVFDEPTNGLDIPSKALFRKIIAGSLDETQLVIISTHQVKDVENLLDKIVILDSGKIIFNETTASISGQLKFSTASSPDAGNVIYSETVPGGYKVITPANGAETSIDIELLFNAAISGKPLIQKS